MLWHDHLLSPGTSLPKWKDQSKMLRGRGSPPRPSLHFVLFIFLALSGKVRSRREQGADLADFRVLHGAPLRASSRSSTDATPARARQKFWRACLVVGSVSQSCRGLWTKMTNRRGRQNGWHCSHRRSQIFGCARSQADNYVVARARRADHRDRS